MSVLKNRIRRLARGLATDPDAWLKAISSDELLFLLHRQGQAILTDLGIATGYRDEVAATLAGLPPPPLIDKRRAAVLIARTTA